MELNDKFIILLIQIHELYCVWLFRCSVVVADVFPSLDGAKYDAALFESSPV